MNSPRFNLEEELAAWRKRMLAAGIKSPEPVGELENHLREDLQQLLAAGETEAAAFQIAAARVGPSGLVAAEFDKNGLDGPRMLRPALLVWGGMVAALAVSMMTNYGTHRSTGLLMAWHTVILTGGYLAALVAGVAGIVGLFYGRYRAVLVEPEMQLRRTIRLFTRLSAGLVVVGFVLGMIWWRQQQRILPGIEGRAFVNVCVAVWLVFVSILQWRSRLSGRLEIQLGIAGNVVIGLACFAVGMITYGYGVFSYWLLDVLMGVHLFLLGVSARPDSKLVKNRGNYV